ncbi:Type 1 glutamine amidotransferase-like domain-containing protein [Halobacillus shinanisalinarum]|uniref:Type 1 glutamine amidotransferase-like domain-containing protein n=1 Tax=Halobacillus shinanisalinarum TaxID=2932258 RepID=A0ABY4H4W1_9BACI|nr:Type 1 glutamine amidotransferase-like domain-containing protein [Halobacillus shinanisalinarum]UOQ95256.1 Type 1 glutamine amidotransferase-like domain-containing protein [Halobacillus shinanisalinarum]
MGEIGNYNEGAKKVDTHLFLFGGGPPMTEQLAGLFVDILKNTRGTITVLYIEREGSEAYLPNYTRLLKEYAPRLNIYHLPIDNQYTTDQLNKVKRSTGILIGGGSTSAYHKYIVTSELAAIIQERFKAGVPVAGFSAGALIAPRHCVISPKDNIQEITLYKKGLGLLQRGVISAHYLKWQEQKQLKNVLHETKEIYGYGIADQSGIYFKNQQLTTIEGYVHIENPSTSGHPKSG